MKRYLLLIRGINVGGNNKVSMIDLKNALESAGMSDVSTYINSGNVFFKSKILDLVKLVTIAETLLKNEFNVSTKVAVISVDEFQKDVRQAPIWWDKKPENKYNALFAIAPATAKDLIAEIGTGKPEYEKVVGKGHIIFWSASLKFFSRTQWAKIAGTPAYQKVTIRNANTVKKLYELSLNY